MPVDVNVAERLVRIETNLENLVVLLKRQQDETDQAVKELKKKVEQLSTEIERTKGVVGFIKWLGAPLVAAMILVAGKFQGG